jgi:carbonic anhydrase
MSSIDRTWSATRARISSIDPLHAKKLIDDGAFLVDTRPAAQRSAFGTIPGAVAIERTVLEWRLDPSSPHRHPRAQFGEPIVVFCQEGYSSVLAVDSLVQLGLRPVHDLAGGFDAWMAAGLPVTSADDLVAHNVEYASRFEQGTLSRRPTRRLAVIACMDSRMDLFAMLGLREGEAHIIRNAGGIVTEHEIRSLAVSQRLLGTEEIILIHHTDCGAHGLDDAIWVDAIAAEVGVRPDWAPGGFGDLDDDVRQSVDRLRASPFLPHTDRIRGFVYDVTTGLLREVA